MFYTSRNNLYSHVKSVPIYQFIILTAFLFIVFNSHSSYAIAPNPGAICANNFSQGSLTNSDYTNLVSAVNTNNYVSIAGNASGSIPLQIKISTIESSTATLKSNFGVITASNTSAINIRRTFPTTADFTDITLEFRNSITAQPLYLTNVALSAFDIDYANSNGNTFDDFIQITGVNESGNTIAGTFQSITGSNIGFNQSPQGQGLFTRTVTDPNCPAKGLGTQCQGSVQFSQPVSSVKIRYANTGYLATTSNQEVDFRVDNYCYVPQYVFSGIVFDDNGGITAAQSSATNADITAGVYANNSNYFNGVFNPSAPETGISGSTVKLASCTNTSTVYAMQPVTASGTTIGQYQISVPISTLNGNTSNLCLVEERTGNTYPLRTTGDSKALSFATSTYSYPNNNFGRVIAKNAGLVLEKEQAPNNCKFTNFSGLTYSKNALTSSDTGIGTDIRPGLCIAYKITVTNRANIDINDFVMKDVLQKKSPNGATITSVLALPARAANEFSDNLTAGQNGTVITKPFTLIKRAKRSFYFNTQYGSTQSN
ncbi:MULTISPECIES: hypothetical protein [unclassified Psychrobacter]|uniref:hypothetical protein n=1 Tax=unclassified Psychrobacter TaxID=196806 RepID=UPI0025B4E9CF|nr:MULTISPECIES: hypothetical protein [unclassified Psychrobacter]MDN3453828.1 hypothetical protein [Psychrobacter sp. APC 3350]MDN3501560.1 hypothetical protein [Psychrobacter sp. 5A.1]